MVRFPKKLLRTFRKNDDGYVTIEALIAMPVLLTLFATSWTFFDAFRQQSINQKVNYAIGDMISRETLPIDDTYINSVQRLFFVMTRTGGNNDSDIRVTSVRYNSHDNTYNVDWSEARGDPSPLTTGDLQANYLPRLPVMAHEDRVIVVETWDRYQPVFQFADGLSAFDITTYSFTRPRFVPDIAQVDEFDNGNWDPANYNPQIPENEREGSVREEGDHWFFDMGNDPEPAACYGDENCSNHDGANNTGGGDDGGGGAGGGGGGGGGGGFVPTPPVGGGGGGGDGNTGGGGGDNNTGGNNGGGNTGGNNGNNGGNNGGDGGQTATPPPPPPPPPPVPPGWTG